MCVVRHRETLFFNDVEGKCFYSLYLPISIKREKRKRVGSVGGVKRAFHSTGFGVHKPRLGGVAGQNVFERAQVATITWRCLLRVDHKRCKQVVFGDVVGCSLVAWVRVLMTECCSGWGLHRLENKRSGRLDHELHRAYHCCCTKRIDCKQRHRVGVRFGDGGIRREEQVCRDFAGGA